MAGEYLIDTSVAIALLRGDADVMARLAKAQAICISVTVLGELLFGALRSRDAEQSRLRIAELASVCPVLPQDEHTAEGYARLRSALAAKGKPIPENDIWIAASAQQYGLILATRDEHFSLVDGLQHERW